MRGRIAALIIIVLITADVLFFTVAQTTDIPRWIAIVIPVLVVVGLVVIIVIIVRNRQHRPKKPHPPKPEKEPFDWTSTPW